MKRKGLIIVAILAIVAVVLTVVFITLFRKKDTNELAANINEVVALKSGYLNDQNESNNVIDDYLNVVVSKVQTPGEINEIKNYAKAYQAYEIIGAFYNRQMPFAVFNATYKNNRKAVARSLSNAQDKADNIAQYLNNIKGAVGNSDYWQANTWADCKEDFRAMFASTAKAFNTLGLIYQDCVKSYFANNEMSDAVVYAIEFESTTLIESATQQQVYGANLLAIANSYLTVSTETRIYNYEYASSSFKDKIKDILENGNSSANYTSLVMGSI